MLSAPILHSLKGLSLKKLGGIKVKIKSMGVQFINSVEEDCALIAHCGLKWLLNIDYPISRLKIKN